MSHPVIVIGTGPVGIRFVKELLKADPLQSIIIFGNEPWQPYNRVKLSALLAADIQIDQIDNHEWQTISQHPNVTAHHNCHIKSINRDEKVIVDEFGKRYLYSNLVLAVGSRPYLPNIPGIEMRGVYTFRDMTDVQALIARQVSSRKVCVIGGGLLGLETAKALARHNTEVIVLQRSSHIMNNQLDAECATILARRIEQQGITIRCGEGVVSIQGEDKVTGLTLRDGETIECDTIVVSAGIIPNKEIAFDAELPVGRGIKVNDRLQTSDPHIYAIGECAEHDGQTYGLVSPGFEQAAIAARIIANENNSTENDFPEKSAVLYIGSTTATELKVVNEAVFSIGEVEKVNDPRCRVWTYKSKGCYRKIISLKGQIIGAQSIGDWPESRRIAELCRQATTVSLWQLLRFKFTGSLLGNQANKVVNWPNDAIVCQCMSVSKDRICDALASGCQTLNDVSKQTGASSVCGSCKPLVSELAAEYKPLVIETDEKWKPLIQTSLSTLVLSFIFLILPGVSYSLSVQEGQFEQLWSTLR